jgi:hypothetical protein
MYANNIFNWDGLLPVTIRAIAIWLFGLLAVEQNSGKLGSIWTDVLPYIQVTLSGILVYSVFWIILETRINAVHRNH